MIRNQFPSSTTTPSDGATTRWWTGPGSSGWTRTASAYTRTIVWTMARRLSDRRGVQTQEPKASGLRIGEQLIQGDHPVVAYRRRRQALIEVHGQR